MKRIAKFHKVSEGRFVADWMDTFGGTKEAALAVYEQTYPSSLLQNAPH